MARELRPWLSGVLLACGVIGLAYLPPRGVTPTRQRDIQAPQPSAARKRAQALALQWRSADRSARLAEYRQRLRQEIAHHRATGRPGPLLHLGGRDAVPPASRQLLQSALDTVWHHLGLGVSKVSVVVVMDWKGATTSADEPQESAGVLYLLPDSTDRGTCMTLIPGGLWPRRVLAPETANDTRFDWFTLRLEWLRNGLGPCAFYAAYGTPGEPVRQWLAARQYDLARSPDWNASGGERPLGWPLMSPATKTWNWYGVYSLPAAAVACLAGRANGCRAAVLAGADRGALPSLRQLAPERRWWREERLSQSYRYLSDVAREVGRDRFLRFWNSPLPVDTALTAALRAPVGEWTARWQRRFAPRLPLGASAPPLAAAVGIMLAAVALAIVAVTASRRAVG